MTPSTEEIFTGQKAYQRIKVFDRNKWSPVSFVFIVIFLSLPLLGQYQKHGFGEAFIAGVGFFILIAAGYWQYQGQKRRTQRDLAYLETLKAKYGQGVYSEIQKEPRSLYYYIFQKKYPPFNHQSLKLP